MKGLVIVYTLGLAIFTQGAPTQVNGTIDSDCSGNDTATKMMPNPMNCSKYYQCVNGTKTEMDCPAGQEFNPTLRICDDPKYANCKVNGSASVTLATVASVLMPIGENATGNSSLPIEIPKAILDSKENANSKNSTQNDIQIISLKPNSSEVQVGRDITNTSIPLYNIKNSNNSTSLNSSSSNNSTSKVPELTTQSSEHVSPQNVVTSTPKISNIKKVNVTNNKDVRIFDNNPNADTENSEEDENEKEGQEDNKEQNSDVKHTYRGRNKND